MTNNQSKKRGRGKASRKVVLAVMPNSSRKRAVKQPARSRGLFSGIGNSLLPGIGGAVGQIADNFIGGAIGSLLGGGGRGSSASVAKAGRSQSRQINSSHEVGVEQVATITVPAGTPAGTLLYQSLIAAPELGVRLAAFAKLWTKTAFLGFAIDVTSSNPSTVPGNYTVAIDPDPVQSYVNGPELPGRLMALTMASKANAWADAGVLMRPNSIPLFNRFNIQGASDAEIREYAAGQILMATTTDYPEECTYTINIGWSVHFERPDTTVGLGGSPSIFSMSTAGSGGVLSNPDTGIYEIILDNATTEKVWSRIPPAQTFDVTGLTIRLINNIGGSNADFSVQTVAVSGAGTTARTHLIATLTFGTVNAGAVLIEAQIPGTFQLVGSTLVAGMTIKQGYATLHPIFARKANIEWFEMAQRRRVDKSLLKTLENLRNSKVVDQFSSLTIEEIDERCQSLLAIGSSNAAFSC